MMNKLIYFFLFLLVSLTVKAQFTSEGADLISRFRPGVMWFNTGLRPAEIEKVRKYDRLVFDITYSDWAGESKPFQNKWASLGMDIPNNYEKIVQYCYEDVCETADPNEWSDGDVAIAFRRWIEEQ